jgi:hypothetical protein
VKAMGKFNFICPDHYPMKCNLSPADKDYLLTPEKYKAFFIFQYKGQDEWLQPTVERYFNERTWRLFNAGKEGGTGTKFCNVCRYALASDFGIVSLTPLNYNVFQEIGLMQGIQKPLIYLVNANQKGKLPFDIDDQIYVEHSDAKSLIEGLDNKMQLLINKLILLTGFETEQNELIKKKIDSLSPEARELLKRIVLEGQFSFRKDKGSDLDLWVNKGKIWTPGHLNELRMERFIVSETESGGSRTLVHERLNEPFRKILEKLLF